MLIEKAHDKITKPVIGCALRVHGALGNGFPEVVYHRSLAHELTKNGLAFQHELHLPVFYDGVEVGARRVDFLVAGTVLVELKAATELTPNHYAQIINYLKAYRLQVGLLINFGQPSLVFKRFLKDYP